MTPLSIAPKLVPRRTPVREGLLIGPLENLDAVRLAGTQCQNCKETALGSNSLCLNCGRDDVQTLPLAMEGVIWTFTIVRHKPPGDYRGPEPFRPFGLGLIELADGLRVLSPIEGELGALKIGDRVRFKPILLPGDDGGEIVAFTFALVGNH